MGRYDIFKFFTVTQNLNDGNGLVKIYLQPQELIPSSPPTDLSNTVTLMNICNNKESSTPGSINISIFEQVKDILTCPITLDIIKDIVITSDSFTCKHICNSKIDV